MIKHPLESGSRHAIPAVFVAVAAAAFAVLGSASVIASPSATAACSRPADGSRMAVECRVSVPGLADGKKFTYAFVRKGCYHPGSAVVRSGEIVVRRNDIGNGSWHISLKPKPSGKGAATLRFGFSVSGS